MKVLVLVNYMTSINRKWESLSTNWIGISCPLSEVESSRTSLASRTSSRTHFEVLGLSLETSSPRKLACPRLEDSTIFWNVKILWSAWKIFWKTFFSGDRLKNFCEDLFFFFWRSPEKFLWRPFFFFWRSPEKFLWRPFFFFWRALALCVLGPWPWPRAFLSLASRVSVLGKAVLGLGLGLGFFLCPWPWPRALCPRLHLCPLSFNRSFLKLKICTNITRDKQNQPNYSYQKYPNECRKLNYRLEGHNIGHKYHLTLKISPGLLSKKVQRIFF